MLADSCVRLGSGETPRGMVHAICALPFLNPLSGREACPGVCFVPPPLPRPGLCPPAAEPAACGPEPPGLGGARGRRP